MEFFLLIIRNYWAFKRREAKQIRQRTGILITKTSEQQTAEKVPLNNHSVTKPDIAISANCALLR